MRIFILPEKYPNSLVAEAQSQWLSLFNFSSIIFKKIAVSLTVKPSEKNIITEEELDCIDIGDIENVDDSPRLVLIDEECGNLIIVNHSGEPTGNISQKKK